MQKHIIKELLSDQHQSNYIFQIVLMHKGIYLMLFSYLLNQVEEKLEKIYLLNQVQEK